MTFKFEERGAAIVEPRYGIEIYRPRLEPGNTPAEVEYQYHIDINGRSDGIGFYGATRSTQSGIVSESFAKLSLGPDEILQWFLGARKEIACTDDEYAFIAEFARALILVFKSGSALYTSYHYSVTAREDALIRLGVKVPANVQRNSEEVVLAELSVPRRNGVDTEASV